jgi:hypothetical protein
MSFSENEKEDDEDFYRIEKSIIEDLSNPKNVSKETDLTLFNKMLDISNMTEFAKSNSEFRNEIIMGSNIDKGDLIKSLNTKLGTKAKKKKKRCPICNKKLKIINFKCKCNKTFCALHRMPEQHNCLYDYKTPGRRKIREENPRVVAEKIRKI